jgi:hypothetical protein
MVIHDFDVFCTGGGPTETNAELVVNADAVLIRTVALERLETVPGRDAQVFEPSGDLQLSKFASRD